MRRLWGRSGAGVGVGVGVGGRKSALGSCCWAGYRSINMLLLYCRTETVERDVQPHTPFVIPYGPEALEGCQPVARPPTDNGRAKLR